MVGVAVNVTDVPSHIVLPGLALMLTDGLRLGLTVRTAAADVAAGLQVPDTTQRY